MINIYLLIQIEKQGLTVDSSKYASIHILYHKSKLYGRLLIYVLVLYYYIETSNNIKMLKLTDGGLL